MSYEINEKGFCLSEPQMFRPWYNYLSNGDYGVKISHTGDGYATTLKEPRISVTNYDFFSPCKGRYVYVQEGSAEDGCVWSPSYLPCKTKLDSFECIHEPGATNYRGVKNGIEVLETVFLPKSGTYEIMLVKAKNISKETKKFSVTPEIEFLLYNSFGVDPVYYCWYTDTTVREDSSILFERRVGGAVTGFFKPLEKPASFETSLKRFFAGGDQQKPLAVFNEKLSCNMSGGDPYIAACKYDLALKPGEEKTLAFFTGVGVDVLDKISNEYKTVSDVEKVLEDLRSEWKKKLNLKAFEKANIKDEATLAWLKTFFGYQIYEQSTGLVRGTFRGFRDVAQDAMGICSYDKDIAANLLVDLCTRQKKSGQCLRQWNTEGGANDERDFRDLPFWIITALSVYERFTGDSSIYTKKAKYLDDENEVPLFEHAVQGIKYALVYGDHQLVKMGIGDWNDALSGPGKEGGTVFLNQFAFYALDLLDKVANQHGFSNPFDIKAEKQKLFDGVMAYWNGKWFARAASESGFILGGNGNEPISNGKVPGAEKYKYDGQERIFLLPQVWFTISGMSEFTPEAKEVAKIAIDSMLEKLETEHGLLKVLPGFNKFDPSYGNLSALAPGMAENFAIYNHSSAFAVYALFKAGRTEDAKRILNKVLPFKKDWKVTKAEPFVLVNFYNGGYYKDKAGEGGVPWLTGTINWLSMSVFDFILPQGIEL